MQAFSSSDPFATRRLSFFANTLFVIGIMVLYMLAGALLFPFVNGGGKGFSLSHFDRNLLLSIRFLQAGGQILVLAMPVKMRHCSKCIQPSFPKSCTKLFH